MYIARHENSNDVNSKKDIYGNNYDDYRTINDDLVKNRLSATLRTSETIVAPIVVTPAVKHMKSEMKNIGLLQSIKNDSLIKRQATKRTDWRNRSV